MLTRQELFSEAKRRVALRRQQNTLQAADLQQEAFSLVPGYRELQEQIRQLGFETAILAASGASSEKRTLAASKLKDAQKQRRLLLAEHGYDPDSLNDFATCSLCKDTGVVNGKVCNCVKILCRSIRREEMCAASNLSTADFEGFDFSYYPDTFDKLLGCTIRQYMKETLDALERYADTFDEKSSSLLLTGDAGLGKTRAALAIAGRVLEKGFDVIYISAEQLFSHLEKHRFEDDDTMLDAVLEADLLILDDLGTEYANSFMLSCFYNILETRLNTHRPTIYTSNITDGLLFEKRYTEKIASRLGGSCETVPFYGEDIRRLKKLE